MRLAKNNSLINLWKISEKKYLFFLQFFCKIYLSLVAVYISQITATDEEVIMAARKANADAFIRELEKGYDTIIGEQGDNLSGGQRQRIAIARALLKDAPFFIFDEATSALDNETERKINESIEVCSDKTIIIVAHRESALRNVDRIISIS